MSARRRIPLVAMSGYAFANFNAPAPDFLRMALELGASRCLRKPFTPVALLTVINECLAEGRVRTTPSRAADSGRDDGKRGLRSRL